MEYAVPIIVAILFLWLILANVCIVPQAMEYVVERLGKYRTTWSAGIHIKFPFIDRIAKKVTMKE